MEHAFLDATNKSASQMNAKMKNRFRFSIHFLCDPLEKRAPVDADPMIFGICCMWDIVFVVHD